MKFKIIIIIFILGAIITPSRVFAQVSTNPNSSNDQIQSILSVSPAILEVNLKKGNKQTYEIKVKNLLNQPLGIRAGIENFSPSDEENDLSFSGRSPLMKVSELSKDSFIIQSGETQSFNLIINTPANLKDGGYYEAVLLVPFYLKNQNPTSPTVLTQVGILVFGNSGEINYKNLSEKVKILDLKLEDHKDQTLTPLIRVDNLYFNHFSAKPFLTITPLFGKSQKFELTEKKILPGKIRRWDESLNINNKSLIYKADLALSVGQGSYVNKSTYFTLFPFKNVIFVSGLILFVIFIYLRRKQVKRAIKVVISGK